MKLRVFGPHSVMANGIVPLLAVQRAFTLAARSLNILGMSVRGRLSRSTKLVPAYQWFTPKSMALHVAALSTLSFQSGDVYSVYGQCSTAPILIVGSTA